MPTQRAATVPARSTSGRTRPPAGSAPPAGSGHLQGFQKFGLGDELGRGGMGSVRTATDHELGRQLAIKLLRNPDNSESVERFIEEAQITAQLEHPNIVPVHELGRDPQGRPWLAMKRIDGESLADVVSHWQETRKVLTATDLAGIVATFLKLCDALAFAHSRGVTHRDLKPANVMVGAFGEVLLVDWGLARPNGTRASRSPRARKSPTPEPAAADFVATTRRSDRFAEVTMQGDIFGTPAFMPPEQASGRIDEVDERSDIFSLGAVLYQMLTLEPPYKAGTSLEVVVLASRYMLIPPRKRAPGQRIPKELAAIVMKAMAKEPRDRYQTVREFQQDLLAWQAHGRVRAWRPGPVERLVKWARRHPRAAMAGSMAMVFVAILAGLLVALQAQKQLADSESQRRQEAEAIAAERAELLRLMNAEDYDAVLAKLGSQRREDTDDAIRAFIRLRESLPTTGGGDNELIRLFQQHDVDECVEAFERLFQSHLDHGVPIHARDFLSYGVLLYHGKNQPRAAIEALDRAIEMDPGLTLAYGFRGNARMRLGEYGRALLDFDRTVRDNPANPVGWGNRALARKKLGDIPGALADYDRAIGLDATDAVRFHNRGDARRSNGDADGALADFNRAIQLRPQYAEAWHGRGVVKFETRDFTGALADVNHALGLDPDYLNARVTLGNVYYELGRPSDAIAEYDAVLARDPESARALANRGMVRQETGDTPGSVADLDRALAIDPDYVEALYNRSRTRFFGQRNPTGAIADLDRALQINPKHVRSWINRGLIRKSTGDTAGAIRDLQQATEVDPSYPEGWYNLGNTRRDSGDPRGAIADYTRAIEASPEFIEAYGNRATAHMMLRDNAKAMADLDAAIRINPDYLEGHYNRGAMRFTAGDVRGAMADFDEALRIDPRNWQVWAARATVLQHSDTEATVHALQQALRFIPRDHPQRPGLIDHLRQFGVDVPD